MMKRKFLILLIAVTAALLYLNQNNADFSYLMANLLYNGNSGAESYGNIIFSKESGNI